MKGEGPIWVGFKLRAFKLLVGAGQRWFWHEPSGRYFFEPEDMPAE